MQIKKLRRGAKIVRAWREMCIMQSMTSKDLLNQGGPAFPGTSLDPLVAGMSLRDYFASGLANAMMSHREGTDAIRQYAAENGIEAGEAMARIAYSHAEYMLAEREK